MIIFVSSVSYFLSIKIILRNKLIFYQLCTFPEYKKCIIRFHIWNARKSIQQQWKWYLNAKIVCCILIFFDEWAYLFPLIQQELLSIFVGFHKKSNVCKKFVF